MPDGTDSRVSAKLRQMRDYSPPRRLESKPASSSTFRRDPAAPRFSSRTSKSSKQDSFHEDFHTAQSWPRFFRRQWRKAQKDPIEACWLYCVSFFALAVGFIFLYLMFVMYKISNVVKIEDLLNPKNHLTPKERRLVEQQEKFQAYLNAWKKAPLGSFGPYKEPSYEATSDFDDPPPPPWLKEEL